MVALARSTSGHGQLHLPCIYLERCTKKRFECLELPELCSSPQRPLSPVTSTPPHAHGEQSRPPAPSSRPCRFMSGLRTSCSSISSARIANCDVDHRGPLLDMGTDAMAGRYGWIRGLPPNLSRVEHDGATWARMVDRKVELRFTLLDPTPIFVAARVEGYVGRGASVAIDDQPLGTLGYHRDEIRIATTTTTTLAVDRGLHTLTLHFFGNTRESDAFADFDWIRVGIPDDSDATYSPPTERDVIAHQAALGGVPHQAIALRAPGSVRCPVRLPPGAHLRAALGAHGAGTGQAQISILRDNRPRQLLRTIDVEGGDQATWAEVDIDALGVGGAALELRAVTAPRGGRILFGDPVLVLPPPASLASEHPPPPPTARVVVIVALNGVERAELPPWSEGLTTVLPTLHDLATSGATFDQHRAPTTVVAAAFASMLTGLPPAVHALTDAGARLPASVNTIAQLAREASVRAGLFTGVPYTFRTFGFANAWEKFVEYSPSSGAPATAPLDDAAGWISDIAKNSPESRILVVVHARGGHPPWDVTPKELAAAPPTEYGGLIRAPHFGPAYRPNAASQSRPGCVRRRPATHPCPRKLCPSGPGPRPPRPCRRPTQHEPLGEHAVCRDAGTSRAAWTTSLATPPPSASRC